MVWSITADVAAFRAAAGGFLTSRPAAHTIPLTVVESLAGPDPSRHSGGTPLFGWWAEDGGGAFIWVPPWPLLIASAPAPAVPVLAGALADRGAALPGVNGTSALAEAFATEWCRRTGAAAAIERRTRLFRLGTLAWPAPAPQGRARLAGEPDRAVLQEWVAAFGREVSESNLDPAQIVTDHLRYGGVTLWTVDGVPVATASRTPTVARMARVSLVYTPPEHRGRGYGGAATAAATRAAQDAGAAEVVLFTDLANPTSNALYPRLGYEPVEDRLVFSFVS